MSLSPLHQTGITAEQSSEALFITFNVKPGQHKQIRLALKRSPEVISNTQSVFKSANLHAVIGIGNEYWSQLSLETPKQLTGFQHTDLKQAPDTPVDLILHIRSDRRDITSILAQKLYQLFSDSVSLVEEVSCFKYLDSRD
ncbi:Dyp-type peroxidase [Paucibacter sp. O1-1]|nr:Dyp-type peroxidase [Paucibacter sp. O1-1]MDA3831318.1 Dyp-type peroxidase [Paucibacter sp. O1-1]